jgi:hypothetical protein
MAWRVTVRSGPRVERWTADDFGEALERLEAEARAAATGPRLGTVDIRTRRYEAEDRVATRAELAGPQRWRPDVRAGLDVRGDGSVQAWTGGARRAAVAPEQGEDAYDALRRALSSWASPDSLT